MKKTDIVLQILGELINNGILTVKALKDRIKIPHKELTYILRELEFLKVVNVRKGEVYLSSQAYSLLFDAVIASRGLERYIERHFHKEAIKEIRTIPGLLVPILLLRAATPYFGLILRELVKKGEIQIDKDKMGFLLEYFSPRKVDYSSLADWKDVDFNVDEFYDLWVVLNKELLNSINIKRPLDHLKPREKRQVPSRPMSQFVKSPTLTQKSDSNLVVEDRYFGIPESSIKTLFGISEESKKKTQIKKTRAKIPSNLRRIAEIKISLPKILRFVKEHKNKTEGLVVTVYDKALRWEFRGKRIIVPTLFLLEDGIYIDERNDRQFSDLDKLNQARYLEDCMQISERFYGSYGESSRSKQSNV